MHIDAVLRLLAGETRAARILIPLMSFRKDVYSGNLFRLLEKLRKPEVIIWIDESTEVYKAANGKLVRAVDNLRTKYAEHATVTVFGMSGTPELENRAFAARAKTLFGTEPKLTRLSVADGDVLLSEINPQRQVARREIVTELSKPMDDSDGMNDGLDMLSKLVVGNALYNSIWGDSAVKKLVAQLLISQIVGYDQSGGVLFQNFSQSGRLGGMLKVDRNGVVGKETFSRYETVVVAVDSPYGSQELWDALKFLQPNSGTDELRAFTAHDLRLTERVEDASAVPARAREWRKRDLSDQKVRINAFYAATAAQTGTTIAIIDKRQALSGTNDFAKNVQRAVAVGSWEAHETNQLYHRLCRSCALKEGDFVPKVLYGVHITMPFANNLVINTKQRASDGERLTKDAWQMLDRLKQTESADKYYAALSIAAVLAATELPGDPACVYLENRGSRAFEANDYRPLLERLFEKMENVDALDELDE